jgi:hypothetical protein
VTIITTVLAAAALHALQSCQCPAGGAVKRQKTEIGRIAGASTYPYEYNLARVEPSKSRVVRLSIAGRRLRGRGRKTSRARDGRTSYVGNAKLNGGAEQRHAMDGRIAYRLHRLWTSRK